MPLQAGTRLGPYEVVAFLGAGGMGEVWLATELRLGRKVALKLLPSNLTSDAVRIQRFEQEARAASALNHPNVCTIYALGETDEHQHYIAMEYVEGETLGHRLVTSRLSIREALDIAIQVAAALSVAHATGIAHRDIKPENVMLRPDGVVKVLDFGLAKLAAAASAGTATRTELGVHTDPGKVVGTAAYMSPEQARGHQVDARTDIWSLGVMLYEMIAGRSPFSAPSGSDVLAAILQNEPPPLARFHPETPGELQRILTKTLRKDRAQRYQTVQDLLLDLQALRDRWAAHARSDAVHEQPTQAEVLSNVAANTAQPSLSSAEYVGTQLARHRLGVAVTVCAFAVVVVAGWLTLSRRSVAQHASASVAVLPFRTIGVGDEYFADGVTEAITTELGRAGHLRVIASNTSFKYRDRTSFEDIARDLGVGLIVTGSVQRAGGTVRIDVSLINTRDGTALWSDRYNRAVTDVLAVQEDISQHIAARLSQEFGGALPRKSQSLATANPEAYDAYLRGVWHLKGRSSDGWSGAEAARRVAGIEELERAVARDAKFSLAHAALASAYTQRFFYEATDPSIEQKAFLEIERALAINPDQAEAYLARAQLTWNARNGFPHVGAITDLRRALSINPNLAEAYIELGKIYYHIGVTDQAVAANEQAQRLDPSGAVSADRRLRALIDAGRLDDVSYELDRNRNIDPYARADALLALGRLEEALRVLLAWRDAAGDEWKSEGGTVALMGVVYARLTRTEQAERMIAAAIPKAENPTKLSHVHHAQFHIGATLGLLGRHDEAVRWLRKAAEDGYPSYPRFSTDQSLTPLKGHAGFDALIAQLREDWDRWRTL